MRQLAGFIAVCFHGKKCAQKLKVKIPGNDCASIKIRDFHVKMASLKIENQRKFVAFEEFAFAHANSSGHGRFFLR